MTLLETLTESQWDRRKRNAVARQIALQREGYTDDPVVRLLHPISPNGKYERVRARLMRIVAEANGCVAEIDSWPFYNQGQRRHYGVRLFGHSSDVHRSINLFSDLENYAMEMVATITGEAVAQRRRQWLGMFLDTLCQRLTEVGAAPSMSWLADHQAHAHVACEVSEGEWHREPA